VGARSENCSAAVEGEFEESFGRLKATSCGIVMVLHYRIDIEIPRAVYQLAHNMPIVTHAYSICVLSSPGTENIHLAPSGPDRDTINKRLAEAPRMSSLRFVDVTFLCQVRSQGRI
jgi:hypothetical protein